tara:strand:- start:3681 stop:4403 length:723 start_codon:yes stop_codon:yes gene_type:complete
MLTIATLYDGMPCHRVECTVTDAMAAAHLPLPAPCLKNGTRTREKRPCVRSAHGMAHTQTASHPLTWCDADGVTVRCLTVRETAVLMGFREDWLLPSSYVNAIRALTSDSSSSMRSAHSGLLEQGVRVCYPLRRRLTTSSRCYAPACSGESSAPPCRTLLCSVTSMPGRARAGVFERAYTRALRTYRRLHPTAYYCVDSSYVKNRFWQAGVGRNHTDRGGKALKLSIVTDQLCLECGNEA